MQNRTQLTPSNDGLPKCDGTLILRGTISAMMKNSKHTLISASTGFAVLAVAVGAAAVGAIAVGAVAVGAFAIGKLGVRQSRIEKLEIGELTLDRLVILERTSEDVKDVPDQPAG
ncbi:MAG: hypothetical protein RB191_04155 [Terriglobia bacterium]|nr:hypothetical protein [Terriglobia bacterium]